MASIFKKIGKAIASPYKGAVNIVKNPKKGLKNLAKSAGKGWEAIDDVALPALGMLTLGPAGAGLGAAAAKAIGGGKPKWGKVAKAGAVGLAGGAALQGLGGFSGAASKLGALGKGAGGLLKSGAGAAGSGLLKLGKTVGKAALTTDNEFDLSKLLGLGMAGSGFVGARQDQAAANKFNAGNAAMRNELLAKLAEKPDYSALMNRITQRPNYTF